MMLHHKSIEFGNLLIYIEKNIGQRTEPCGTPLSIKMLSESELRSDIGR